MKPIRAFVVLIIGALAYFGWSALHPQQASADFGNPGSYLVTITDATTGAFASRSVITLHADNTASVVDSAQGGPGVQFSGQQGAWERELNGTVEARTIDFSFPSAGIARVDYKFNPDLTPGQVRGTIRLTLFPLNGNPLDGGGTVAGNFNFTGQRITVP